MATNTPAGETDRSATEAGAPDGEAGIQFLGRVWSEWERSAARPYLREVAAAVLDGPDATSDYAAKLLCWFQPAPLDTRTALARALATEDRQVRLQAARELLTLLLPPAAGEPAGPGLAATDGPMTPTDHPPVPTPVTRPDPAPSLWVAVGFTALSVGCVASRTWATAPQAVYALAAVFALAAYAFLTRWVQRVDRSGSPVLQFLERIRCYLAHEDPAGPATKR